MRPISPTSRLDTQSETSGQVSFLPRNRFLAKFNSFQKIDAVESELPTAYSYSLRHYLLTCIRPILDPGCLLNQNLSKIAKNHFFLVKIDKFAKIDSLQNMKSVESELPRAYSYSSKYCLLDFIRPSHDLKCLRNQNLSKIAKKRFFPVKINKIAKFDSLPNAKVI